MFAVVGWSALVAAVATVAGAVFLAPSTAFLTWIGVALTSDVGLLAARGTPA